MGWLDGRVALVTGGGSGIGLAVVERFLAEGAQVAVLDRSKDNIEELKYRHPGMVALVGDVTVFGDNQQAVATTVSAFGKLDVFVGNAGIFDYFAPLLSLSGEKLGEAFDELFAVNVKAYLFGARAAIPELLKANDPCMIFTVSTSGFYTSTGGRCTRRRSTRLSGWCASWHANWLRRSGSTESHPGAPSPGYAGASGWDSSTPFCRRSPTSRL